jgi:glycosyltransferase involved in cell wall biosynthesis
MRFSLLHPSRQRLTAAEHAIGEWTGARSGRHEVEYLLSVDADDDVAAYRGLAARRGVQLIVGRNRSLVDAVNRAARVATGDVLIVVSDDFGCPDQWDEQLAAVIGERRDVAVLVHDGHEARILTLPILGRALYEQLGFVYYPEYFSMYCDDDLTHTARGLGKLIDARHLVFPHRHWSLGGLPFDDTYARENGRMAWLVGVRVFGKRRAVDFGRRPRPPRTRLAELRIDLRYWVRISGHRVKRLARRIFRRPPP